MRKYKVPLGMITIFHPEVFWGAEIKQIPNLSVIDRDRHEQELFKERLSIDTGFETHSENFHNRIIKNFGKPKNIFRKTWIKADIISLILSDYNIRLISTLNEEGQAKYKLEARPNWGDEVNTLPNHLIETLKAAFQNLNISIRQVWVNPIVDSSLGVQLSTPFYKYGATVNLVLGPCDEGECMRQADVRFIRENGLYDIHQHRSYKNYKGVNFDKEMIILSNGIFWWIEY